MHAILRELPLSQGTISVRGVISYASQEPWLFAGSVQQNILFGLPMDVERYKQVNACELSIHLSDVFKTQYFLILLRNRLYMFVH